jgi:hypothetical protein
MNIHDIIVNNLPAFIARPDDDGNVSPADNVAYLITLIKTALLDLGYNEQEALDIINDD